MRKVDLAPAAQRLKVLLDGTSDDQLSVPTPCTEYSVGDLLDHLMALTVAFRDGAVKASDPNGGGPPEASAANLPADWRAQLPVRLDAMVRAWAEPDAWQGETTVGGVTMPAEVIGVFALDEIAVHGWDLARATGQPFDCDQRSAEALFDLLWQLKDEDSGEGIFGRIVDVPTDAPLFDRVLGLTGRDPAWTPVTPSV